MTPAVPPPAYPEEYAALPVRAVVVAGSPGAEKTALIGRLCAWFEALGLRAAVLILPETTDLWDEGKDTWRFRSAGASVVALAGPGELHLTLAKPDYPSAGVPPFFQALTLLTSRARVIFVDGWEAALLPAILVAQTTEAAALLEDREFLAVVSDLGLAWPGPRFRLDQVAELGQFLKDYLEIS